MVEQIQDLIFVVFFLTTLLITKQLKLLRKWVEIGSL